MYLAALAGMFVFVFVFAGCNKAEVPGGNGNGGGSVQEEITVETITMRFEVEASGNIWDGLTIFFVPDGATNVGDKFDGPMKKTYEYAFPVTKETVFPVKPDYKIGAGAKSNTAGKDYESFVMRITAFCDLSNNTRTYGDVLVKGVTDALPAASCESIINNLNSYGVDFVNKDVKIVKVN